MPSLLLQLVTLAFVAAEVWGGERSMIEPPKIVAHVGSAVELVVGGQTVRVEVGGRVGPWTLMAVGSESGTDRGAVWEDFSTQGGRLVVEDGTGRRWDFPKSVESTQADPQTLYRGHTLQEVLASDHDLLGGELLAQRGDPSFGDVAACFAPITRMETYTFVGTRENPDKVGVAYGGRTANFDPAVLVPAVAEIRARGRVREGLCGGWLPVLRFVYPEKDGDWTELALFAPPRLDTGNPRLQPVWYRVCRIEGGLLKWAKYFDTYPPAPPREESRPAADFYRELLALRAGWETALAPAMTVELPDRRLADLARHSLVRAMMTRVGSFPKYGVLDRNYGGAEHDGFQDTCNVDVTAMMEWGLGDVARDYLDNYLSHFVRDDGSILYRGPETGQYGRMLAVVAEYFSLTGEAELLVKHRGRLEAITQLLRARRDEARKLPAENPAYGMIAGWSEADSCLEPEPGRYVQPYFSNSSEAVRGFGDLGAAWESIGRARGDAGLTAWGGTLRREAQALEQDLHAAIARSRLVTTVPACIPVIAGAREPFDVAAARDRLDPQFRAYRGYMELLHSGCLTRAEVETIVNYREAHRDILLGVPTAYGFNSGELVGFLSYGHAYGLLQHDRVREYLLELHSLAAHHYTRGTWTAPETRRIDPTLTAAPYCVPAQLAVPLLVRWMLAFEEPRGDGLWLAKATPRDWLEDGKVVAATAIPTRWGRASFRIESHLAAGLIRATVDLPAHFSPHETKLRLRVPAGAVIDTVLLAGKPWTDFDRETETVTLPAVAAGRIELEVRYRTDRAN